jgi:predicted esterase
VRYADRVTGAKIGFAFEQLGHFQDFGDLRRQAERDAAEVRAVANEHHVARAIGFSRGARAIVGALADDPSLFERAVLVIPPGGHVQASTRDGSNHSQPLIAGICPSIYSSSVITVINSIRPKWRGRGPR